MKNALLAWSYRLIQPYIELSQENHKVKLEWNLRGKYESKYHKLRCYFQHPLPFKRFLERSNRSIYRVWKLAIIKDTLLSLSLKSISILAGNTGQKIHLNQNFIKSRHSNFWLFIKMVSSTFFRLNTKDKLIKSNDDLIKF